MRGLLNYSRNENLTGIKEYCLLLQGQKVGQTSNQQKENKLNTVHLNTLPMLVFLFFVPEDGGGIFFRYAGEISTVIQKVMSQNIALFTVNDVKISNPIYMHSLLYVHCQDNIKMRFKSWHNREDIQANSTISHKLFLYEDT
jgi:hypothetical protein